ncbi:hypothetical protein quinque_004595 [Culex quinquefasciatus]
MKMVHTIRDTPPITTGLFALNRWSGADDRCPVNAFSQMGTEVATASEKGTVIRVFSVNDSSKQFELRRDV